MTISFCRRTKNKNTAINAVFSMIFLTAGCGFERELANEESMASVQALYDTTGPSEARIVSPTPANLSPNSPLCSSIAPIIPSLPPVMQAIDVMVRNNPRQPYNERFLNSWQLEAFNITDQAQPAAASVYARSGPDGTVAMYMPAYMFNQPLVIKARNASLALECKNKNHTNNYCEQGSFEIFVPAYCFDKAVWMAGPVEHAVWQYYKKASSYGAEAWNPSQVDCGTWLANLQLLIITDPITDALDGVGTIQEGFLEAIRKNQRLLVNTRSPLCLATEFHSGGDLRTGEEIKSSLVLKSDDQESVIELSKNGTPSDICGIAMNASLLINDVEFSSVKNYKLKNNYDFFGIVHEQKDLAKNLDVSVFNVKLGNGQPLKSDIYNDACALTSLIRFTNKDEKEEQNLNAGTGVRFYDLFGEGPNTAVYKTSSGDALVDEEDNWAIFYDRHSASGQERVLAVELLGHRAEDFRDQLHINFDLSNENLFLGLRGSYELDEQGVDGEVAFTAYTIHAWDGSSIEGRKAVRNNMASCLEASEVWARQFFSYNDLELKEQCIDGSCTVQSSVKPLVAAEFAVRSQCFSNSRANQRWQNNMSAFWNIGSNKNARSNVIVNPGWLAPRLDYHVYIQKFDETVFKGPRTIKTTDDLGRLMFELPTLVEGDRVLLKSVSNCCSDYDVVLSAVPEFTGFGGEPGLPYVPHALGPQPPIPPFPGGPVRGPIGG